MQDLFRNLAWRFGRKLYCWARGDLANDPSRNGEYWLARQLIEDSAAGGVLMDVGANVGEWSRHVLSVTRGARNPFTVLAFEPCSGTRSILEKRVPAGPDFEVIPLALSASEGEADFFSGGDGLGTNSLNSVSGSNAERVQLTTLDRFLEQRGIDRVTLLKIDTEGFDLSVLQGAVNTLAAARIEVVQFEYNWRWLLNKASLLDVFNLLHDKPYWLGKLTGNGIVFYEAWHPEMDRYFENNYVLVRRGSRAERLGRKARFDASNVAVSAA